MMIKKDSTTGFTLIEMIVSIGIIILISLVCLPLLKNNATKAKFDSQIDKVISAFREAESLALSGQLVNSAAPSGYGVNLVNNTSEIIVFIDQNSDKKYNNGEAITSKINLEEGVKVSSVSMDVFWDFLNGEIYLNAEKPASNPIITIIFAQTNSTKTATIKVNSITGQISKD